MKYSNLQKTGFLKVLHSRLFYYHRIFPTINLKPEGKYMEELIHQSFTQIGYESYITKEHYSGTDIIVSIHNEKINISLKSGKISKQCIKYSSYRTSTYPELEDKIKYCESKQEEEDIILLMIPEQIKNKIIYSIFALDPKIIDLKSLKWTKHKTKNNNITHIGEGLYTAEFIGSMSGQLWVKIPLYLFELLDTLEIDL